MHHQKSIRIRVGFCLTKTRHAVMGSGVVNQSIRAFTLIELLIVVAIISILAGIAVPNFLEAQTRAKVARVLADMRTMQTAIEMYRVDENKAPIRNDKWEDPDAAKRYIPDGNTKLFDPSDPDARVGLRQLTTPVAYLGSLPPDIFNQGMQKLVAEQVEGASMALDYWDPIQLRAFRLSLNVTKRPGDKGFALLSVGPDGWLGGLSTVRPGYPEGQPQNLMNTIRWIYDASNGTTSAGNVYKFSDGLTQGEIYPM